MNRNRISRLFSRFQGSIVAGFLIMGGMLLLKSCSQNDHAEAGLTVIDFEQNIDHIRKLNMSNYAKKITYAPLQTEEDLVLGDYLNFDCNERYFVTTDPDNRLLLFDIDGTYIRNFGGKGRGPGEYLAVSNLQLLDDKVVFNSLYDVFVYSVDGSFIQTYSDILRIDEKYFLDPWVVYQDSLIFGHIANDDGQTPFKALLINFEGEIVKRYKNNDILENKGSRIPAGSTQIYTYKNDPYFKEEFSDTIFRLDKSQNLVPHCLLSLGKLKVPKEVRSDFFSYFPKLKDYVSVMPFMETEESILFDVRLRNRNHYTAYEMGSDSGAITLEEIAGKPASSLGIYDKKSGEMMLSEPFLMHGLLPLGGLRNDMDMGPDFFPGKRVDDGTLVMILPASSLKAHLENQVSTEETQESGIHRLARNIKPTDNPVLVFIELK